MYPSMYLERVVYTEHALGDRGCVGRGVGWGVLPELLPEGDGVSSLGGGDLV